MSFYPRRYIVTGIQPVSVDGPIRMPGDIFEADIPLEQEIRLLNSGALTVIPVEYPETLPPLDIEPPLNPEQEKEAIDG
jgi:hypothetical protein